MKIDLPQSVKRFDFFGAPMPSFNLQEKTQVRTSIGACASLFITAVTIAFAGFKLENLLTRHNATIINHEIPLEHDENFDIANSDFMIAFALESWD